MQPKQMFRHHHFFEGHLQQKNPSGSDFSPNSLTTERGGEAEDVVAVFVEVPPAVVADPRGHALAPAGHPGLGDGVLDRPVRQPARVAPAEAFLPGLEELVEGGQSGVLLLTDLAGPLVVELVAAARWLIGEHHAWSQRESNRI